VKDGNEATVPCKTLLRDLRSGLQPYGEEPHLRHKHVVAEGLMRSFEINSRLATRFRKSNQGDTWVAESDDEVASDVYLDFVALLMHVARLTGDIRFLNTVLKVIDEKCNESAEQMHVREGALTMMESLLNA